MNNAAVSPIDQNRVAQDSIPLQELVGPRLFQNHVGLENRMITYCQKYCPNISIQEMKAYIRAGEVLENEIANSPRTVEGSPEKARHLMWLLMAKAAVDGKEFASGVIRIDDPGKKIELFLKSCGPCYARLSTHFKENLSKDTVQWGLDLRDQKLPSDKHTILFGFQPVDQTTFIKIEKSGCPPFWKTWKSQDVLEYLRHSLDYLTTRLPCFSVKGPVYKEHVPKDIKKEFKHTITTLFPPEKTSFFQGITHLFSKKTQDAQNYEKGQKLIKTGNKFGISKMKEILEALPCQEAGKIAAKQRMIEILDNNYIQEARGRGYAGLIKGQEVTLARLGFVPAS